MPDILLTFGSSRPFPRPAFRVIFLGFRLKSVYFMPVRSRIGIDSSDDGVRPGGDVGEAAPAEDVDAQDLAEGGDPV